MKQSNRPFDIFLLAVFLAALWLLVGCTTTRYVPVEKEVTHTEYRDRATIDHRTDTLYNNQYIYQRGDTLIVYRDRWRVQRRIVRDTVLSVLSDTIRLPTPYPVERKLTRWERTKQNYGGYALATLLLILAASAAWLIRKLRRTRMDLY